jgi:hypothetical protein
VPNSRFVAVSVSTLGSTHRQHSLQSGSLQKTECGPSSVVRHRLVSTTKRNFKRLIALLKSSHSPALA